jgi:hypothetical protein
MSDADWDEDVQGPATEARAQKLEATAARVRARLGESEWRRLTRLVHVCWVATAGAGVALMAGVWLLVRLALWAVALLPIGLLSRHWRESEAGLDRGLLCLAAAAGIAAVFIVVELVASAGLRRSLWRHAEEGEDVRVLEEALWAGYAVRRIRRRLAWKARQAAARARLAEETRTAPPWWRVEGSGAYLVWWLCAAFWPVWLLFRWPLPDRLLESIGVTAAVGPVFRLILLAVQRGRSTGASDRLGTVRFYWWWARGWLPALLALAPGVVYWVVAR